MTLVVSDISKHGVVMVGDSAITKKKDGKFEKVETGAVKVQYCRSANIGISMWGYGQVNDIPLDKWISKFLQSYVESNDTIESVGTLLSEQLNEIHIATGKSWSELICGFHLGGYINDLPHLYHVHCGHSNEQPHELRLYKDYPNEQHWNEKQFRFILENEFCHIRNGYNPIFGLLFENTMKYAQQLKDHLGITFPQNSIKGRLLFYKELVKFVAGVLTASGINKCVNDTLSAIAFNQQGIAINEQLAFAPETPCGKGVLDYYTLGVL